MSRKKPTEKETFVMFNVTYEDGTQTSNRRVPKNGMAALSTCPISMTSPVLINRTALSTDSGLM